MDLKGENSVPETVHHVKYRVNPLETQRSASLRALSTTRPITDNIHTPPLAANTPEYFSQQIKELKMYALLGIIDHFKVCTARVRVMYVLRG